jgi:hypothetical protein
LTGWAILINVMPTLIHLVNNVVIRVKLPKELNNYSQMFVLSGVFIYMGVKMNQSMILTIGTRYVKQLKYRNYFQFIVQTLIMFVIHTGMMVALFFSLDTERSQWGIAWGMILSAILLNMYQCFALNFENYAFVAVLSIFMNLVVALPSSLVALLKFQSLKGVFFGQMICNGVQIVILGIVIHGWNMWELKSIWLELSARRRVGDEEALIVTDDHHHHHGSSTSRRE